jgi:NADH:ubiquinone oxidoreductase subunit C
MLNDLRTIDLAQVRSLAEEMLSRDARLSTVTAVPLPGRGTRLIYHYTLGSAAFDLDTVTPDNRAPSIADITPAADWIEREIHDLYGVEFTGHPDLARLVRPSQLPVGFFREG